MNTITIIGYLGRDPEKKDTKNGKKFYSFSLASTVGFGENKTTNWFSVTVWQSVGEGIMKHLKKGSHVLIAGQVTDLRAYKDKSDKLQAQANVSANRIEFMPSRKEQEQAPF